MLQVQGYVPDKRLDESLLQPEPLLSLIERFIFDLWKRRRSEDQDRRFRAPHSRCHSQNEQRCTCGEIPVRCLRWLLTRLDFLMMECMLSLEILSINVSSSPFLYFTTVGSGAKTVQTLSWIKRFSKYTAAFKKGFFFFFTEVLPALELVDVYVDLFDGQQSFSQLGPVVVALRRGPQQLHQQQRVTHHPLHRLD